MSVLSNPLKLYIFAYGLKAGLPFALLARWVNFIDALRRPRDWLARRLAASRLLMGSKWRGFLPRNKGAVLFGPGDIPGLEVAHEIAAKIYAERKDEVVAEGRGRTEYNPFYFLLNDDEVVQYPELVEAALSPALIESITDYLGAVPRLQNINVWLANANTETYGSNIFHLDKPDVQQVSVFINVFPVLPENGPLTALPADLSREVCKKTAYEKLYYLQGGRLSDEAIKKSGVEEGFFSLAGPAGAGGIVDTSTCLHYGSRCREGERVTLVFRYAPAHKIKGSGTKYLPKLDKMDKIRQMMLDVA
jgi:hypothetical protein